MIHRNQTQEALHVEHLRSRRLDPFRFSAAMSEVYREEVPAYGTLMALVVRANEETLATDPVPAEGLKATDSLDRISEARHDAIRPGTAEELSTMRRVFAGARAR